MSDVPRDELVEILSRLPVKSLLRFRSVSKPLRALIDRPAFVNRHLSQSKKTDKILTFSRGLTYRCLSFFCSLYWNSLTIAKLETPFDGIDFFTKVFGSCNDLICLSRKDSDTEVLLWNPSTRKYKLILAPPVHYYSEYTIIVYQVGYDHVNDDYKVVRLPQYSATDDEIFVNSNVIVYSLKLNAWQSVEKEFPYNFYPRSVSGSISNGVCVNGAIHWIVTQNRYTLNNLICAFDLASQSFRLVPQVDYSEEYVEVNVGILGGCLCVICNDEFTVDIWVMGEYGVNESWRKLLSLTMPDDYHLPSVRPVVYSKNGKEVFLEANHEWLVYDLEKKKYKKLSSRIMSNSTTYAYQETLV